MYLTEAFANYKLICTGTYTYIPQGIFINELHLPQTVNMV